MQFDRSEKITILVILLILLVVGFFTWQSLRQKTTDDAPVIVPAIGGGSASYTDLEGNQITLTQFEGKPRIVNSWASWCPFCVDELPDFATLAAEYATADLVVLAINRKEEQLRAASFVQSLTAVDGIIFLLDPEDAFYKSIGGFSMPETLFYDRAGNVVVHKRGFMSLDEMRLHTDKIIAEVQ